MLVYEATRSRKRHMQTHGTRTETLTVRVTIFKKEGEEVEEEEEECFRSLLRAAFKCYSGYGSKIGTVD